MPKGAVSHRMAFAPDPGSRHLVMAINIFIFIFMVFDLIFAEHAQTYVKKGIFICFKNPHFFLFSWVLEVKLIFQDKFYDIIE